MLLLLAARCSVTGWASIEKAGHLPHFSAMHIPLLDFWKLIYKLGCVQLSFNMHCQKTLYFWCT